MIYHVYKTDCYKASRVMMQSNWTVNNTFIHRSLSYKGLSVRLGFFNIFKVAIGLSKEDVLVFHAQSSLPYLLFCKFVCILFFKNSSLVYDMHDLHELGNERSIYSRVRYFILLWLEYIVFKIDSIKKITVSNGLSEVVSVKYRAEKPRVVYNCSFEIVDNIKPVSERGNNVLFFGTQERFPLGLLDVLQDNNMKLDFYGRGVSYEWLRKINKNYDERLVNIYGEYSPDSLSFVSDYKVALNFFPKNDSLNFKYSLPNKLFQAIAMGATVVVSENFNEMIELFSDVQYAVVSATEENFVDVVTDIVNNKTMEDAKRGMLKLLDLKKKSMNNYKEQVSC